MSGEWKIVSKGKVYDEGVWEATRGETELCTVLKEKTTSTPTQPTYTIPTETTPVTETINYEETMDTPAVGDLKKIDPMIREALKTVFGGVKLYQQFKYEAIIFGEYVVPRAIMSGDFEKIIAAFESVGFETSGYGVSEGGLEASLIHLESNIPLILFAEEGGNLITINIPVNITITTPETTTPTETENITDTYSQVEDLEAAGVLRDIDPMIRKALSKVLEG